MRFTVPIFPINSSNVLKTSETKIMNQNYNKLYDCMLSILKDYKAKMFQAILMTTFSSSLFVRQWVQAKDHKESL
jgi:hypothetical protein